MTAQKGEELLLKVGRDGGGTFVTVGGLGLAAFAAKVDDATADESGGSRSKDTQRLPKGRAFRHRSWAHLYGAAHDEMCGTQMICYAFKIFAAIGIAAFASFTAVAPAYAGCMPLGSAGGLIKSKGLIPGRAAVSKAQAKGGGKVIKIVLCQNGNNFVYRATVLGKQGAVKNISVNAKTGQ